MLDAFEQRAISKYSVPIFAAWARSEKERLDKAESRVAALDLEVRSLLGTQAKDRAQIAALQSADDTRARQRPLVLMAFLAGPVLMTLGIEWIGTEHSGPGWAMLIIGTGFFLAAAWADAKAKDNTRSDSRPRQ